MEMTIAPPSLRGKLVGGCYLLGKKLGSGTCGEVYMGTHWKTGDEVAVKIGMHHAKTNNLFHESEMYKTLEGSVGIPNFISFGIDGLYNVLVLEKVGPTLHQLFLNCKNQLSLKTVLILADQVLTCIQLIHEKGIIHRDVTTSNLCMGNGDNKDKLYLIDFGSAIMFRDPTTGPCGAGNRIVTNTLFGSQINDAGFQQGRIDDLQSIGYILVRLLNAKVPWEEVNGENYADLFRKKREVKTNDSAVEVSELCPSEFVNYLIHCHELRLDEIPDYEYLRRLFSNMFKSKKFSLDNRFDWDSPTENNTSVDDDAGKSPQPIKNEWRQRKPNKMPAATPRFPIQGMHTSNVIPTRVAKVGSRTAEASCRLTKAGDLPVSSPPRRAKFSVSPTAAPRLTATTVVKSTGASRRPVKGNEVTATEPGCLAECWKTEVAPCRLTKAGNLPVSSPPRRAKFSVSPTAAPRLTASTAVKSTGASRRPVKGNEVTATEPGCLAESWKPKVAPRQPTGGVCFRLRPPTPPL